MNSEELHARGCAQELHVVGETEILRPWGMSLFATL